MEKGHALALLLNVGVYICDVQTQALPCQLKFTGLPSMDFVQRDKNKGICKGRKYEFQKGILKISFRKGLFLTTSNRLGSVFRVKHMCVFLSCDEFVKVSLFEEIETDGAS